MKTFVIAGHCSTQKKIDTTKSFIEKIKQHFDCRILYVDHLACPNDIEKLVDFSLHVTYNPIQNVDIITDITRQFKVPFWNIYKDDRTITKTVPIHSYAHHNSLYHAFNFLYNNDIENIHFLNYDCDEDTFEFIEKNEALLNDNYEAAFFPYRYDPLNGVNTEFFSVSRSALEKMFLKMDSFGSYENRNIVRLTDYNIEYTYYSHLKYRKIKYFLHDMWSKRDGEIGIASFFDEMPDNNEIKITYNTPNNLICSVVPIVDFAHSFKISILFMRFGHQIGDYVNVKFLGDNFEVLGSCDYNLPMDNYFWLEPIQNTRYVSTSYQNLRTTFDLLNMNNYGEIE